MGRWVQGWMMTLLLDIGDRYFHVWFFIVLTFTLGSSEGEDILGAISSEPPVLNKGIEDGFRGTTDVL